MGHRHEYGTVLFTVFEAWVPNGAGTMKCVGQWSATKDAYISARSDPDKYSVPADGEIREIIYTSCGVTHIQCNYVCVLKQRVYNGNQSYWKPGENGWSLKHDPRKDDPEYQQYLALKKKFEK